MISWPDIGPCNECLFRRVLVRGCQEGNQRYIVPSERAVSVAGVPFSLYKSVNHKNDFGVEKQRGVINYLGIIVVLFLFIKILYPILSVFLF